MRQMARVWNLDDKPYTENFKDTVITIGANKCIVMEPTDADLFMRAFTPVIRDVGGNDIRPKKLRKEMFHSTEPAAPKVAPEIKCMIDGEVFKTQKTYDAHVKEYHLDQIVDKESKDAFLEPEGD